LNEMPVFLRVTLIATAAFIVVEAIPLAWFNFVLCWVISRAQHISTRT